MALWNRNKEKQFKMARRKSRQDGCGCVGKEKKIHVEN
jgi:hypothetical protein